MNTISDYLEHHGVKGQKWGVRRAAKKEARSEHRLEKKDSKWAKQRTTRTAWLNVYNMAAQAQNADLPDINHRWRNVDVRKPGPNQTRYYKEITDNFNKHLKDITESEGFSPSGKKKLGATYDFQTGTMTLTTIDAVEHADDGTVELILERDSDGLVTKITIPEIPDLMQSAIVGKDFLDHHGVKGQKWGVRKKRSVKEEKVISKRKKVSKNRRTISDVDLKKHLERLSNEKKLKDLVDADVAPGKTAAKKILSDSGQKVARTVVAGAVLYGTKVALTKKFDRHDAASFITPKPKK